jgi:hypothetical protein
VHYLDSTERDVPSWGPWVAPAVGGPGERVPKLARAARLGVECGPRLAPRPTIPARERFYADTRPARRGNAPLRQTGSTVGPVPSSRPSTADPRRRCLVAAPLQPACQRRVASPATTLTATGLPPTSCPRPAQPTRLGRHCRPARARPRLDDRLRELPSPTRLPAQADDPIDRLRRLSQPRLAANLHRELSRTHPRVMGVRLLRLQRTRRAVRPAHDVPRFRRARRRPHPRGRPKRVVARARVPQSRGRSTRGDSDRALCRRS